jgi:acyl-CoA thioester hydrolase
MDWPVQITLPVRWGELDALGHVNNTVFFRWFEDVRIATFAHVGIRFDGPHGVGPILATTSCDFLAPVTYPSTVQVGCHIGRVGRTSFVMHYQVQREGLVVARGQGVIVLVDYRSGDKVVIDEALRARLEACQLPQASSDARSP